MIKKLKTESCLLLALYIGIFFYPELDIKINNFFLEYNRSVNGDYFKKFFINITEVGNSLWFFLIAIILFLASIFLQKIKKNKKNIIYSKQISVLLFFSILITGIITQTIKHIVGRPRPNYAIESNSYELNFFNLESVFHSFPSGHTSTIFVVALVMSFLTPKIKYVYIFFALLVSLSRVVVGAHYFLDIVAGIVVAFIGFKVTFYLFEKYFIKKKFFLIHIINSNLFILSLITFCIAIIFISIGPSIDIFISSLFYSSAKDFILQDFSLIAIVVRKIFLPLTIFYILFLPIVSMFTPIKKIYFNYNFNIKTIVFIWISTFFNLIFIINVLLKNMWGRARPNDIIHFGGKDIFTPWFKFSQACSTNCSFVSGDASVGFAVIILFFITRNIIFFWVSLFFGIIFGIIRIMEGGHFLSDILVAGFLIYILTFIQSYYFNKINKNNVV